VISRPSSDIQEFQWVYGVNGVRVLADGLLIATAPAAHVPGFVLGVGALLIAAGVSTPLLGEGRVNQARCAVTCLPSDGRTTVRLA
jgi:hypothetical protein